MRTRDRERLNVFSAETLEAYLKRLGRYCQAVQNGPWIPWLPPGLGCSQALRLAARIRSGAVRLEDPRIPPGLFADLLEQSVEKERVLRATIDDIDEYRELVRTMDERYAAERRRSMVAGFHRLKESPEAQDPDSPAGQRLQRLKRVRRQEGRRSRRRYRPKSRRLKVLAGRAGRR